MLLFLLILGLLLRLAALHLTPVVNPDAAEHVEASKAIYFGRVELLRGGNRVVNLYTLSVATAYRIVPDWIMSSRLVALMFGILAIVPIFFVAEKFFEKEVAVLCATLYVLNPYFVSLSVEVTKEMPFLFFLAIALYLVLVTLERPKRRWPPFLAGLTLLSVALTRIEGSILLFGTLAYLALSKHVRGKAVLSFAIPLIVFSLAALVAQNGPYSLWQTYIRPRLETYGLLGEFWHHGLRPFAPYLWRALCFFPLFCARFVKILHPPFLLFFLIGLCSVCLRTTKEGRPLRYLLVFTFLSISYLFLFYVAFGFLSSRYLVPTFFLGLILCGMGIERIVSLLKMRGLEGKKLYLWLFIALFLLTVPVNLKPKRYEKLVFKEIGDFIRERERGEQVEILGPDPRIEFYANLDSTKPKYLFHSYHEVEGMDCETLKVQMKNFRYFVFQRRSWPKSSCPRPGDGLREVRTWHDPYKGEFTVFEVER